MNRRVLVMVVLVLVSLFIATLCTGYNVTHP